MAFSLRRALAAALVALSGGCSIVQAMPQTATGPSTPSNSSSTARVCNNSPALCSRLYSQVTFMGAHDSAFLRDESTKNSLAGNQYKNATVALDAGIRLLQAQVHKQNDQLRLCHTSCALLDAGPLDAWLAKINTWMTQNPNDVVTILLVNSDDADVTEFATAFQSSGLSKLGYAPPAVGAWPTLDAMITNGTRVVSFIANIKPSSASPYLLSEFDYVFETFYEVTDLTGFNCTLDRPDNVGTASAALGKKFLGLVNHFKYQLITSSIMVPDVSDLSIVNSADTTADGNLGKHLQQCSSEWNQRPNFVLVDFWDVGATVQAADNINGIKGATGRENSTNGSNDSVDSGSSRNLEQGALIVFLAVTLLMV
ncbi:PI-PLC X domain-containing protein 1 [Cladobotryum mycophilum]|uniref:PI-PLC X domain-containing protein 1 n=1 Tax=Cladobotryum mycophilum TaxID=491253 RepID=A0ABR0SDC2_9HYPO